VEADRTFQNQPKPFIFEQNKARFSKFLDRIIHVKLTKYPLFIPVINPFSPWKIETYQRNSIVKGLKNCAPDDIIMISDVDEIPNGALIRRLVSRPLNRIFGIRMHMFMYYFNHKLIYDGDSRMDRLEAKKGIWHCMAMLPFKFFHDTPNKLRRDVMRTVRRGAKYDIQKDGGWHFTYMGGYDMIVKKLESFSHSEYNLDEFKDRSSIEERIRTGQDLFGRDLEFKVVDPDYNMPSAFSDPEFRERFKSYFLEYERP
ncbi:MAG: hypothetical protein EOO01_40405, partial [Chitinophagaceae bacterium]